MISIKTWFATEWVHYNQTFFGWLEVIVGSLEFIDMQTVQLVSGLLGPKYGPAFAKGLQISMGLRIAYVGYKYRKGRNAT